MAGMGGGVIDWREVDLGDAKARRLENGTAYDRGVLVSREEDGAAYVAMVTPDGLVERTQGGGTSPVWSAMMPELWVYYVAGTPPRFHPGDHDENPGYPSSEPPLVAAWELLAPRLRHGGLARPPDPGRAGEAGGCSCGCSTQAVGPCSRALRGACGARAAPEV